MKKLIIHFALLVLVTVMRETLPCIRYGMYLVQVESPCTKNFLSPYIFWWGEEGVLIPSCLRNVSPIIFMKGRNIQHTALSAIHTSFAEGKKNQTCLLDSFPESVLRESLLLLYNGPQCPTGKKQIGLHKHHSL